MKCRWTHWRRAHINGICIDCHLERMQRAAAKHNHPAGKHR